MVSKVRRCILKGEVGRATAAASGPSKWASATDTLEAFRRQQHADTGEAADTSGGLLDAAAADQLRRDVEDRLANCWLRTPQGAGTGVQGDRYEHWRPLAHIEGEGAATAKVLARLAGGQVPPAALDVALAAKLLGIAKRDGGTRVLACG